jgi:hypothetical protein
MDRNENKNQGVKKMNNKIYMGECGELVTVETIEEYYRSAAADNATECNSFVEYLQAVTCRGGYYAECSIKPMTCRNIIATCGDAGSVNDMLADSCELELRQLHDAWYITNSDDYKLIKIVDAENLDTDY